MRKAIFFLSMVFTFIPISVHAAETMNSVYVNGIAPINIDGDLSDWSFVSAAPVPVKNMMTFWEWEYVKTESKAPIPSPADLSGSFQCFYDNYYLYVAVKVNDDHLVFGQEIFAYTHMDDSVEIYFDGDMPQLKFDDGTSGRILVSSDGAGKTLNAMPSLYAPWTNCPYLFEELGVKAIFKTNDQGYTVEAAIPTRILGWSKFEPNRQLGMNIRIIDDDDYGDWDYTLMWAKDPNQPRKFWHNHVLFNTQVTPLKDFQSNPNQVDEANNIVAFIGNPDETQTFNNVMAVLSSYYSQKDYSKAESMLNSCSWNTIYWAQFMLADIQFDKGNYMESAQMLLRLAKESPEVCVSRWALYKAMISYIKTSDKMTALDIMGEVLSSAVEHHSSLAFLSNKVLKYIGDNIKDETADSPVSKKKNEIVGKYIEAYIKNMDLYPQDVSFHFLLVKQGLYPIEAYDSAINLFEKISNISPDQIKQDEIKLEKARCSFYLGDYENSSQLGKELISSSDPQINLNVKMLLLSIEKKLTHSKDK